MRGAIYGGVYGGVILRPCRQNIQTEEGEIVYWEATDQQCAIKQYSRTRIQAQRGSAEDPYGEISAMQYLTRYQQHHLQQQHQGEMNMEDFLHRTEEFMYECNVMMPLGVYYDVAHIYCMMPFMNGSELFDVLDGRQKFSEEEARYWMKQILTGVEMLQRAGICHRDMSLENLLTDAEGRGLIIDLRMCLKIPYLDDVEGEEHEDYRDH